MDKRRRRNRYQSPKIKQESSKDTSTYQHGDWTSAGNPRVPHHQLIYDPKRSKTQGMQSLRFARPGNIGGSASGVSIQTIQGTWIHPGRNEISASEWEYIKTFPETKGYLQSNVFKLITSVGQTNKGTLTDYAEADAIELVEYTYDREALEIELAQEKRTSVLKAIRSQLQSIEERTSNRSISLAARG